MLLKVFGGFDVLGNRGSAGLGLVGKDFIGLVRYLVLELRGTRGARGILDALGDLGVLSSLVVLASLISRGVRSSLGALFVLVDLDILCALKDLGCRVPLSPPLSLPTSCLLTLTALNLFSSPDLRSALLTFGENIDLAIISSYVRWLCFLEPFNSFIV